MKQETYYVLDYAEFDKLVKEKLGIDYEIVAYNELNNYSCYDSTAKKEDYESTYYQEYSLPEIQAALRGEQWHVSHHDLLTYMAFHDMIPEGKYLIKVFW